MVKKIDISQLGRHLNQQIANFIMENNFQDETKMTFAYTKQYTQC